MKSLLFLLFILFQQEIPYKANEDFDVTLDYQFKVYRVESKALDYTTHRRDGISLLYLVANVKIKTFTPDEVKVSVTSNLNSQVTSKKATADMVLKIDFGFIDDVKEKLTANEFTIFINSPDKKRVSRIHLLIENDGTFLVNGQKRGKF